MTLVTIRKLSLVCYYLMHRLYSNLINFPCNDHFILNRAKIFMVLRLIQDCPFPEALCSDSLGLDCSLAFLWPSSKDRLFWFMLFPSLSNSSSQLESCTLCKSSTRIKINRVWISLPCSFTIPWLGHAHHFSQPPSLYFPCVSLSILWICWDFMNLSFSSVYFLPV